MFTNKFIAIEFLRTCQNLIKFTFIKRNSTILAKLICVFSLFILSSESFVILSQTDTVVYKVATTTSVTTSGNAPSGSNATYNQTYTTAMQITSGNSATLTLTGYVGYRITGFRFQMKSNASNGAGNMTVTAGTTSIFSISNSTFNSANWNGSYTGSFVYLHRTPTTFHSIAAGESVVFKINATTNSLYIQQFEIYYEPIAAPCSVTVNPSSPMVNSCMSTQTGLSWTHSSCYDEYLVVAKPGVISATPSGDGSAYTANSTYGSGTAFDGGYVVYKGNSNSVSINGLTPGINYEFKVFARRGTDWSTGISEYCTPSSGPCLDEKLQSTTAPSGWISSSITFGISYAEFKNNNGTLTTIALAYPSQLTFNLTRTDNGTAKTLNIRISTTSQTTGFSTVATYTHANTTSNGTTNCTVDLSAYSSAPVVYIQFEKVSSTTSPWRLHNVQVMCNSAPPACNLPSYLAFSATSFAPVEQSIIPSFDVALACSSGLNTSCNDGNITLSTSGCGISGTLIKPVINGKATFNDISFLRSVQSGITFTATYTGSCASSLSATTAPFNIASPPSTPTYNAIKDENFSVGTPIPWAFTMSAPILYGTGGVIGSDVSGVVTNGVNSYLRKSYSVNNSSGQQGTTVTFTFDNVVLNPIYDHIFDFKVASIDAAGGMSSGTGVDVTEDLIFEISLDGGATWNTTFTHLGGFDKVFNFSSTPVTTLNYNANVSYSSSVTLSSFRVNVPFGSTQFMFRFTASSNRTNENWAIDDLKLQ